MGAVAMMPVLGVTVNVMSLFAFIMVLGIVVDDAIIVGENIYRHYEMGKTGIQASIDGASQVAVPVTFSILTTLAAFSPLINIPGPPRPVPARDPNHRHRLFDLLADRISVCSSQPPLTRQAERHNSSREGKNRLFCLLVRRAKPIHRRYGLRRRGSLPPDD